MDIIGELARLETTLWNRLEKALLQRGQVGLGTLLALRTIDDGDGTARVLDVSEALVITVGAASKFVDRMARDGLVERGANPDDRRSSLLAVTASGRAARIAAEGVVAATTTALLGDDLGLTDARRALSELQRRLDAADGEAVA